VRRIPIWHHYERIAARGDLSGVSATPVDEDVEGPREPDLEGDFFRSALTGRKRVLDVGCGPGVPLVGLAGCVDSLCGIDISPAMLRAAREGVAVRDLENAWLVRGSAEQLPFADRSFDGLAVSGTLESVDNVDAALLELARVAEPGAVVASLEWDIRGQLCDGQPGTERWLGRRSGSLYLQVRHVLAEPYRVRDERYLLNPDSEFGRRLSDSQPLEEGERVASELKPDDVPAEAVLDCYYDLETHFDPDTLAGAFDEVGFEAVQQEVAESFGVPHIFSVFRRRSG
jgi:ubiquinone/menaquinone biosynthesis C-methylase UbiE